MKEERVAKKGASGGKGPFRAEPFADVRLRRPGGKLRDEELSEREQRRTTSYGRARGRL